MDLTFAGGSATASNLPSDFASVRKIVNVSTGYVLTPVRGDDYLSRYMLNATDAGDPLVYYSRANVPRFHPLPGPGTVLRMEYLMTPPTLTDVSIESAFIIPKRHHRAIVLGALTKLYMMEDDPELAAAFQQQFEGRLQNMRQDLWKFQWDRPDTILVSSDDYDYYPEWRGAGFLR